MQPAAASRAWPLDEAKVYTLSGVLIGRYADVKGSLQPGIYLCNGRKIRL